MRRTNTNGTVRLLGLALLLATSGFITTPQAQDPSEQCGDLLIRDRHGNWTYQLCVTVDDWEQEIDLVVRGEDCAGGRRYRACRAR